MPDAVFTNPYIGPTAFTEEDSECFFGRAEETRELASLVIARRAVLLHAQAGSGKTSLLQASLVPELRRRKRVETFPIARVTGSTDPSGCLYVENVLAALFPHAPSGSLQRKTLSEVFGATLAADTPAGRRPRLIIVDQFEEIFTYHPELTQQRHEFFAQLGDCLANHPQLSLLLSMREDYLADIEVYAPLLPDRVRTRMRLERLAVESAVEAVQGPAVLAGMPFAAGVAEQLVDNLRRIRTGPADSGPFALGPYVEPVQLQIVCRQLWQRITWKAEILEEDVAHHADVDLALIQFYRDSLAKAQRAGVTERALRLWFSERLITPAGTRGLVNRGEFETEGIPNPAAGILRDCYIIRAELRGGNIWYELAHDRLVDPIREDNLAWRAGYRNPIADALERDPDTPLTGSGLVAALQFAGENPRELTKAERQFLERSKAAERKARARRKTLTGITSTAALVLLLVTGLAVWEARLAQHQAASATSSRLVTAALLNNELRPDLASLLSIEAWRASATFEARHSLILMLLANPGLISILSRNDKSDGAEFSPDSKLLATFGVDQPVQMWDLDRGQPLGGPLPFLSWNVAFSPDGKLLATADLDNKVRLWDVASHKTIGDPLEGHSDVIASVAFSPDGKTLASGSRDNTVRLWDVAIRRPVGVPLTGHSGPVYRVVFSPDGKFLAVVSQSNTVRLWDAAKLRPVGDPLKGSTRFLSSVTFSPDSKTLAAASADNTVKLWKLAVRAPPDVIRCDGVLTAAFSSDGRQVVTVSADGTVTTWDTAFRVAVRTIKRGRANEFSTAAFSPDGEILAAVSRDNTVRLWDVTGRPTLGVPLSGHSGAVNTVAFSPDGKLLASAGADQTLRLWDVARRQALGDPLKGHTNVVWSIAFSPDGKLLASASVDQTVRLWNVARREPSDDPLRGHSAAVKSLAFSPDGKLLASASVDQTVRLWDVARRHPLGDPMGGHASFVNAVAFSPDGNLLASAGQDHDLRLWDLAKRKVLGDPLRGHSAPVLSVAFGPDNRLMVSAGEDRTVRLWEVASHRPIGDPLLAHPDFVSAVAFSPDGKLLASAGGMGQPVRLWDVASRRALGDLVPQGKLTAYGVAFSPDGKFLASAGADRIVWLWDIDTDSWSARLCRLANRNLTPAEWSQFIGPKVPYQSTCATLPLGGRTPAK